MSINVGAMISSSVDQLTADDFLSGPRRFTIREIRTFDDPKQPLAILFEGLPDNKPWKPNLTMRRLLVAGWGDDGETYVGRSLVLFRDPDVRFGKDAVGGIRMSHMEGLPKPLQVMLTVTKGKKAPFRVEPLTGETPRPQNSAANEDRKKALARLMAALQAMGVRQDEYLPECANALQRDITSSNDMTMEEIGQLTTEFEQAAKLGKGEGV